VRLEFMGGHRLPGPLRARSNTVHLVELVYVGTLAVNDARAHFNGFSYRVLTAPNKVPPRGGHLLALYTADRPEVIARSLYLMRERDDYWVPFKTQNYMRMHAA
jgi:hypothetical protein